MKKLAYSISYIFHPMFMLTYLMAYFLFSNNYFTFFMSPTKKLFLLSAVVVFSVILPLLNLVLLRKLGYIKSVSTNQSNERLMPYLSTITLYIGLIYILHDLSIPYFFKQIIIASLVVIAVDFVLNFFTKVSAHTSGIGGGLGIIYFYQFVSTAGDIKPICLCLFIAGLVGLSRLYLNEHTPKQVYMGFAVGLLSSIACLTLLLFIRFQL